MSDDLITQQFREIYLRYYSRMKKFAREFVLSEAEAENMVQDVFASLWQRREMLPFNVSLTALLFTALRNRCLDFLRRECLRNRARTEIMEELQLTLKLNLSSLEAFEFQDLSVHELEEKIQKAIDSLPERCREIFIKSRIEGFRHSEIAEQLDISVKTVENQMTIAYRRLRMELKDYLPLFIFLSLELGQYDAVPSSSFCDSMAVHIASAL